MTIRAEWERIWIDDQEVAIARDRFLNGRHVRIKFLCPACNRGCRILHARGRTFVCRLCAGYDYRSRHKDCWAPALDRLLSPRRRIELGHPLLTGDDMPLAGVADRRAKVSKENFDSAFYCRRG